MSLRDGRCRGALVVFAGVWVRSIRGRPELRDLRVYPLCAVEAGDADAVVAVFYEVEAAELVENNGGSSWPSRNARSMRFQRSHERVRSGMNSSSNQSCFPALPTMRDSSTVALPRRMPESPHRPPLLFERK